MVINDTFNNISVILWWPVLLVEETGVLRETILATKNIIHVQNVQSNHLFRGHLWDKEKVAYKTGDLLKEV
jgi:hypothetical protein